MSRNNFSAEKWIDKIVIPSPLYLHDNSEGSTAPTQLLLPHQDILVESYERGTPMVDVINSIGTEEEQARYRQKHGADFEGSDDGHLKVLRRKEIAALGLDAILKMVLSLMKLIL